MEKWHCMSIGEVEAKLNTSVTDGLSRKEAEHRVDEMIHNGSKQCSPLYCPQKKSALACILSPLSGIFFALYLVLAIFTVFDGRRYLGICLLGLFFVLTLILGIMNMRAIRSKERASMYSIPTVKLIRSGRKKYTDSRNIAVGDIIMFEAGDIICCDARLVMSDGLVVDEYIYDPSGSGVKRRRIQKDAGAVYEGDGTCDMYMAQNILLAGSVITAGSGQAIAIATGTDTALATHLKRGEMSGDIKRPVSVTKLLDDTKKISVLMSVVLILMTVLGMMTMNTSKFSDILLITLSSVMFFSSQTVDLWSRVIFKHSIDRLTGGIVIKNNRALDSIVGLTDMILLGRAGLTDGKLHISSIFMSGRRLDSSMIESKPDRAYRLCEYIYTYLDIVKSGDFSKIDEYRDPLEAFMTEIGFDRDAARLKLGSRYFLDGNEQSGTESTAKSATKITLSLDREILDRCNALSVGDMNDTLSDGIRSRIEQYIEECEANGEKLLFITSEEWGAHSTNTRETVLEGIMAFEEHTVDCLDTTLEEYRQIGVNITALMCDESADNIRYLINSGIISSASDNKIAFASDFSRDGCDITSGYGKYRAYLGFSIDDYARLLSHIKRVSGKVAVYGTDDRFSNIFTMTDISVSCNCIEYDSDEYRGSLYEKFPESGRDNSLLCSQRGRVCADILVHRSDEHGGLGGIIEARWAVCSAYINLAYYLKYFTALSSLILILVFMSCVSGITMLSAVHILFLYLFVSTVGLYCFSRSTPSPEFTKTSERGYSALPRHLVKKSLGSIEVNAVTAVLCFAISLILILTGVISKNGISYPCLVFVFAVAVYKMHSVTQEYSNGSEHKGSVRILTAVFAAIILLIICLSILVSIVSAHSADEQSAVISVMSQISNTLYGGEFEIKSLMLIPVFALIYVLTGIAFTFIKKHKK